MPPETVIARAFFVRFLSTFYHKGILTKIRACEQQQKFCEREQASTHLIFASNSSKGQILRALLNSMRPFNTPLFRLAERKCNVVESLGPSGICNGACVRACVLFRHFMCSSVGCWLLDLSLVYQGKRVYNYPFLCQVKL